MRYDPVIVMAMHRSGSTYLMRLLNACPDLRVWGEHGGFLGGIRESLEPALERLGKVPKKDFDYQGAQGWLVDNFIPFINPFTGADLKSGMVELITSMFSKGLPDDMRWGFKELRYPSQAMVDWFFDIWPASQMVFNLRDPVTLCASSLRAPWVVERLKNGMNGYTAEKLPELVFNTLAKIYVMERLALYAVRTYGVERATIAWHEDLVEDPLAFSSVLFKFLGHANFDVGHIDSTSKNIVGTAKPF